MPLSRKKDKTRKRIAVRASHEEKREKRLKAQRRLTLALHPEWKRMAGQLPKGGDNAFI